MRTAFFLGYGLLPLWLAIAFVTYSYAALRPDQAGMTWWAVVQAIPVCIVTLLVAAIAAAIHARTPGDERRKRRMAAVFLITSTIVTVAAGAAFWMHRQASEGSSPAEAASVIAFVTNHTTVRSMVAEPRSVAVAGFSTGRTGPGMVVYDIAVQSPDARTIYAIVNVSRRANPATMELACTTALHAGQRDARKGACQQ